MSIPLWLIFLLVAFALALAALWDFRKQDGKLAVAARIRLCVAAIFLLVAVALFFLG